jgi:hypothetical protein
MRWRRDAHYTGNACAIDPLTKRMLGVTASSFSLWTIIGNTEMKRGSIDNEIHDPIH